MIRAEAEVEENARGMEDPMLLRKFSLVRKITFSQYRPVSEPREALSSFRKDRGIAINTEEPPPGSDLLK